MSLDIIIRRFERPDEVREMEKGRFELVRLGGLTIGRATYQPGWRWSEHVGPGVGAIRCTVEHVGLVLAGVATVAFEDRVVEMHQGEGPNCHLDAEQSENQVLWRTDYSSASNGGHHIMTSLAQRTITPNTSCRSACQNAFDLAYEPQDANRDAGLDGRGDQVSA